MLLAGEWEGFTQASQLQGLVVTIDHQPLPSVEDQLCRGRVIPCTFALPAPEAPPPSDLQVPCISGFPRPLDLRPFTSCEVGTKSFISQCLLPSTTKEGEVQSMLIQIAASLDTWIQHNYLLHFTQPIQPAVIGPLVNTTYPIPFSSWASSIALFE